MKTILSFLVGLFLATLVTSLYAYPGESIVQDANGDYLITYWNGAELMHAKFIPATKIDPTVKSEFKSSKAGLITYRYTISNGSRAKQSIASILLRGMTRIYSSQPVIPVVPGMSGESLVAAVQTWSGPVTKPDKWDGDISPDPDNGAFIQAGWDCYTGNYKINESNIGIQPGSKLGGFGYTSPDIPGIALIRMRGNAELLGYEDEGPDETSAVYQQNENIRNNDFVTRNVAAPLVSVPDPFDAATLLNNIQTQMHTWIAMKLLDATFSSQLDRYFQSAINAYQHDQPKAAHEDIETMHAMLMREHRDLDQENEHADERDHDKDAKRPLIDRLAARVLDFDLRYVLKRSHGKDKDR